MHVSIVASGPWLSALDNKQIHAKVFANQIKKTMMYAGALRFSVTPHVLSGTFGCEHLYNQLARGSK